MQLSDGLTAVNALIAERVDHDDPFIAQAGSHLTAAGGKRFRPLLTLLAAELGDGIDERVVAAAAGVELTHLASLYHDDVMDEADVRRGAPSANAAYGNSTAILVGDLLFGTASDIVADLGAAGRQDPGADLRAAVLGPDPRRPALPARHRPGRLLPRGARRQDRRAHRHRRALRRDVRRLRRRHRRDDARLR